MRFPLQFKDQSDRQLILSGQILTFAHLNQSHSTTPSVGVSETIIVEISSMSLIYKNIRYLLGVIAFLAIVSCVNSPDKKSNHVDDTSQNSDTYQVCDTVVPPELYGSYEGDCQKGTAIGKDTYEGEFANGYPHGKGTYTWSDGAQFTGPFNNGVPQITHTGCEVTIPRLRGRYDGQCQNNQAHGRGKAKGIDSYDGPFINGAPDGKGTYTWHNGDSYTGRFKNGEPDGCGQMVSEEGREEFNCSK